MRRGPGSLSDLVQRLLGRPLDKQMRMSNWAKRPLSEAQSTYAALDALCLVDCFDVALCDEASRVAAQPLSARAKPSGFLAAVSQAAATTVLR